MTGHHLKICLIGDFSDPKDEGMKKVAYKLALLLSRSHKVLPLHLKSLFMPNFWRELKRFGPEIVLYVGGPSLLSFVIAKAISTFCVLNFGMRPKTVLFALHPSLPLVFRRASTLFRPDLILAQSYASQSMFRKLGLRTCFLPVGVDTEKFIPIAPLRKIHLRKKYGLRRTAFVILHVGSVRRNRGLEILSRIQMNKGNCVLVIGSTSMPIDRSVHTMLTESGCLVWRRHFAEIEELYQLADLYVFPVVDKLGSIELPLSIMEAMACNLPVISTKFGALPRILKEDEEEGLIYVNEIDEIPSRTEQIKNSELRIRTRERVMQYSWESVTQSLTGCLCRLVGEQER